MHATRSQGLVHASRHLALALLAGCSLLPPKLPTPPVVERTVVLDQGWSADESRWFHHVTQGTNTFNIPYAWLVALEQPTVSLFEAPLVVEPSYLRRFGFIPSPATPENPLALPIGFARTPGMESGQEYAGFTCAACHTGQIQYRGTAMVVEGGPALTDLGKFRTALGLALAYTKYLPFRFDRFADRVLGPDADDASREKLEEALAYVLDQGRVQLEQEQKVGKSIEEGFARLDAIGRIGNTVFGTELDADNYVPLLAPVAYPHIWDASWFDWVQYNGSIRQPMVRNSGEALGVDARVNLTGPSYDLYRSSVRVENLFAIENQLAGPAPWKGLRSPRWPQDVLGPIDSAKAARGATLYAELCQGCHLPPVDDPNMQELATPYFTSPDAYDRRYLRMRMVDIDFVGTDPMQAKQMAERKVDVSRLELAQVSTGLDVTPRIESFGSALGRVTENVINRWYDDQQPPTSPEQRAIMNGLRPNDVRAPLQYKARPLNGVWATAPFLHNGSVPDLESLLSPVGERPKKFWLGSPEFDPTRVGYVSKRLSGGFELDTSIPGNSNAGHEFKDGQQGAGVIGRALTSEERAALIEFIKTL